MTRILLFLLVLAPAAVFAAEDDDRVSFGSDVHITAAEDIAGDVVVVGADARVDGRVRGDVVVVGGDLLLGSGARVDGSAMHLGGDFAKAEGALLAGAQLGAGDGVVEASEGMRPAGLGPRAPPGDPGFQAAGSWTARFASASVSAGFLLVVGLLLLATWPDRSRNVRRTLEAAPLHAAGLGLLVTLGITLLTVLLVISVVGWLALPFVAALGLAVGLAGLVGLAEAVGDRLPRPESAQTRAGALVAGCAALGLLSLVASGGGLVAWLGGIILLAATFLGVGGAVLSGLGRNPWAAP